MSMFWILITILMIYFFIIRPLTRARTGGAYRQGGYQGHHEQGPYGPGHRGFGGLGGMGAGLGMFAGGLAMGALLTHLFEQGRISQEQLDHLQSIDSEQALSELQAQGIVDEQELGELSEQFATPTEDANFDSYEDYGNDDFGGGDGGDFGGGGGDDLI